MNAITLSLAPSSPCTSIPPYRCPHCGRAGWWHSDNGFEVWHSCFYCGYEAAPPVASIDPAPATGRHARSRRAHAPP